LSIDPKTYLFPFIQRWPTPSLTAETLLVRREGTEVVYLNELRFQKNTALTLRRPLDQVALPAARAASGQEGIMEGIDYRGVPVVAALRIIPDSSWSLVARMDAAEVYAPLREQLRLVAVLVCALLFGAGAGIALLWRRQRVRFYREGAETENKTRRLATVVRDSNDAITIQDFEGRITAWNHGAELMYGYSEEEALQMNIGRLTAPGKVDEQNDFTCRLIAGEAITSLETQRVTHDGRILDIWMTVTKLVDDAGKPIGIASTERDITARKRAEEALRASEEGFRIAVETANDVIYEWDLKQSVQWVGKIDEMLGYAPGEFPRTLDGWAASVHPEDRKRVMAAVQAHLEEHAVYEEEYRVRTKDGVYRWWSARGAAARTPDGKPVRWIGSITDITERKRVEEALRESQAFYSSLVAQLPAGVFRKDREGRYVFVSPWFCRLKGIETEEFLGKTPQEVAASEAAKQDPLGRAIKYAGDGENQHALIMQTGNPVELIEEYTDAAGGKQFVHAIKIPVINSEGKVIGSQGLLFDITARMQAEEALRTSESMLNEMGRIAEVGGWEMDLITRRARWTKGTYDIVEIGYGDPVPGPDEHVSYYLPEYRPIVEGAMKKLIEEDVPLDFEAKLRTAKGNIKWCRALGKAVRKDDVCMKVYGTFQNITERKRAEEALQASEERFVQFMRNLPAMTFIKDCERRIVFVNERVGQVFGLAAADCLGKVSEDLWPGPIGRKIREDDERVLGNGDVMTVVQEISTQDGPRVFRAIKFLIPRGQQPPLLGDISLDVTEIRQAEEKVRQLNVELEQRVRDRTAELEAANQELEAFSYSVSHDLRAPLRAMDGFSMALLEDCAGKLDEAAQDHLRRIRAGCQRMAVLIDDLLNLSREARTEMRRESVDLTAMAEEIDAELQRAHPDRQVKSVVAPALTADADARMLRMVLHNLLDNAWKFTGRCAQARIEVGAREQDDPRVFFVRDNGAGFDMAYAGKLFGAFQRLHSTQEFAGTGIGLAIVQRIIHRHGGRVWAEGAVGQGATVYFTLGKERD
jgi:PAS domain S-box-containing protein